MVVRCKLKIYRRYCSGVIISFLFAFTLYKCKRFTCQIFISMYLMLTKTCEQNILSIIQEKQRTVFLAEHVLYVQKKTALKKILVPRVSILVAWSATKSVLRHIVLYRTRVVLLIFKIRKVSLIQVCSFQDDSEHIVSSNSLDSKNNATYVQYNGLRPYNIMYTMLSSSDSRQRTA